MSVPPFSERLEQLFAYTDDCPPFSDAEANTLIDAIDSCKILDPACGSGAFPMGILHKLVFILAKLDPDNARWKQKQIDKAEQILDATSRETAIAAIEKDFETNNLDYGRKLYLIENCIYGVDIQPVAIQISKLRFFISLICDQRTNRNKAQNCGVRPLPNLETKFVAANTLIALDKGKDNKGNTLLFDKRLPDLERKLKNVRHKHFAAQRRQDKLRLQDKDAELREQIAAVLKDDGMSSNASRQLAAWDPYDQNLSADFFDPEWMFGVREGFDVVIGNPPYGFRKVLSKDEKKYFRKVEKIRFPSGDVAELFIIKTLSNLVSDEGQLTFIIPKKSLYGDSWSNVRTIWTKNSLRFLMDASQAFDNVLLEQVAFMLKKRPLVNGANVIVGCLNSDTESISIFGKYPLRTLFTKQMNCAQIYRGGYPQCLLDKIDSNALNDSSKVLKAEIGISNITSHLTFQADGNHPCVKGIDIVRYGLKSKTRYLKGEVAERFVEEYGHAKLLAQEIIAHIKNPYPHISLALLWDENGRLFNDTCVEVKVLDKSFDPLFLLGYLQSRFVAWYAYNLIYNRAIRTMHFINYYVTQIPLPEKVAGSKEHQEPVIRLVEQIRTAKKSDPAADVSELEAEIDRLVYDLYGLTEEEIAIVEGRTADMQATKGEA